MVSNFIVQALRGEPLTLYGEGQQTRSFCYVSDLIEGLVRLMNTEGLHDPVNLGNPGEFTIKQLGEEVQAICGVEVRIQVLAFAGRRSETTQAQYFARAKTPGLEPHDSFA